MFIRQLLMGSVLVVLAACSSLDIEAAKKLGKTGGAAAASVYTESVSVTETFSNGPERDVFRLAVIQDTATPNLPDYSNTYAVIDLMKARTKAIGALVTVYGSFAQLAEYDVAAETEEALGELTAQVNEAATAASAFVAVPLPLITKPVGEIVEIGGGLLADESKKRKLEEASKQIRTALDSLISVLEIEKQYAVSIRTANANDLKLFRALLMQEGLADYDLPIESVVADLGGLTPTKNAGATIQKSSALQSGFEALDSYRTQIANAEIGKAYDALLALLEKTVKEHKKLEAGKELDLDALIIIVEQLKSYYDRVKDAADE